MTDRGDWHENAPGGAEPGAKSDEQEAQEYRSLEDSIAPEYAQEKGRSATEPEKPSDAALKYGARGLEVFPVPPGIKKSHKSAEHSGGAKWGKTADTGQIARDWQKWPTANVGIATGAASGLWVIDLDKAPGGLEAWAALTGEYPRLRSSARPLCCPHTVSLRRGPSTRLNGSSRLGYLTAPRLRPLLTPPSNGTQKENRLYIRAALKMGR